MRILFYEIKKILNWKIILLVALINIILYYFLIDFNIEYFPNGRPALDSYHIGAEMVENYGPHLSKEELNDFNKTYEEEVKKADQFIQSRDDFKEAGIHSYTEFQNRDHEDERHENLSSHIMFEEAVDLFWELQERERLLEFHQDQDMIIDHEMDRASAMGKNHLLDLKNSGQYDVFPEVSFTNFQDIIRYIAIAVLMSVIVVISPIFLRDRMNRVNHLQYTSHIGRSIYVKKMGAGLISALIVMTVLLAVYVSLYAQNNPSVFFNVPINAFIGGFYWYHLTFFQYIVLSIAAIYVLGIILAMVAMGVSSLVTNYTALIGTQVPIAFVLLAFGLTYLLTFIIDLWLPIWLVPVCYILLIATVMILTLYLIRREKKIDLV